MNIRLNASVLAISSLLFATGASAQFAASISPPRFEVDVKAGQAERRVIEITNAGEKEARYRVYTADWTLSDKGELTFTEALQPGSCRPWVALERSRFALPAGSKIKYRFEIQPPASMPKEECRLAIFFEGDDEHVDNATPIPMNGRVGVIVYARPEGLTLSADVKSPGTAVVDGQLLPTLDIQNTGTGTIRFSGFLAGRDAVGKRLYFSPSSLPALPGQVRSVAMTPIDPTDAGKAPSDKQVVTWTWPVSIEGDLILSDATKQSVKVKFSANKN